MAIYKKSLLQAVEGESPSSQLTGSHDNQMMTSSLPASQAATGMDSYTLICALSLAVQHFSS